MPFINVKMYEGRPKEKKKELAKGITDVVSQILGTPPEVTTVVFEEIKKENWSIAGVLQSEK